MTTDEYVILQFLRAYPDSAFSRKEISRKAVKRTDYEENPRWAEIPLASLLAQGLVEADDSGCYQLKRKPMPS
jgi:hypothetical protein